MKIKKKEVNEIEETEDKQEEIELKSKLFFCKRCKMYRGFYNFKDNYRCCGCGFIIIKTPQEKAQQLEKNKQESTQKSENNKQEKTQKSENKEISQNK